MEEAILFIMSFFFVLLIYEIFLVRRAKKKGKKKKELLEIQYLVWKYHLDMDKVPYNQLLQIVTLVSSFDIAAIVSIIYHLPNVFLEIVGGLVITLVLIFISYHLVYLFYKRKGMIQDEH